MDLIPFGIPMANVNSGALPPVGYGYYEAMVAATPREPAATPREPAFDLGEYVRTGRLVRR